MRFAGLSTTNYIQSDLDIKFSPLNTSVGTRMTIKSTGNVGIGTDSPDNNLSIESTSPTIELSKSSGPITKDTEIGKLLFTADDDSSGRVREDTGYIRQMGTNTWNGSAANSYLGFGIRKTNTEFLDDAMVLDHNGNVGIGTDSPEATLDVNGTFISRNFAQFKEFVSFDKFVTFSQFASFNAAAYFNNDASFNQKVSMYGLSVYADNTAAIAGGLFNGDVYRTSTGDLKIVY